ncbi:MAG: ABC transporter ATP-binding protein [Actinomycetota bacterium]|nr:ABC transporter ATP-binding protein [Actinomycetota bacterium]
MTALEVIGLRLSFGTHSVLTGVDLKVEDGVTAVLGSSGCGKTTLLRTIAGFLDPDEGSIHLGGRSMVERGRSVPSRKRDIGYVPQEGALFPHLDVARNIAFGLRREERRGVGARVGELLELVELPRDLATRFPHQLSGGQQQRVALARALAPRPSLVLLDEPFSSLDAGLREETGRAVVRALQASLAAGVLVTHDQGEALSLADQVAVMSAGRFLQVDAPRQIYLSPADEQVAAFLGHAALLPGEIASGAGIPTATCVLGSVPVTGRVEPGPVTVAIRPEQLQVVPAEALLGVDAEVVDVSFFGHDATIRARVAGYDGTLTARTPANAVPRSGDQVRLGVIGEALCFPRGGDR